MKVGILFRTLMALAPLFPATACTRTDVHSEAGYRNVSTNRCAGGVGGPAPEAGETVELMVPVRDCTRLSTKVALPDGPGPYPVLLIRTPYGKDVAALGPLDAINEVFTPRGFAVVSQDTRGRFKSDGEWIPLVNERKDGIDTVHWIEAQPWFNGNLGTFGASYLGATELLIAVEKPASLKAMFVGVITSDFYTVAYEHGLMRADTGVGWTLIMADKSSLDVPTDEEKKSAALGFPIAEGDLRGLGYNISWDDPFLTNDTRNSYFLDQMKLEEWRTVDVPIFMLTGFMDFMVRGQLEDFDALWKYRNGKDLSIIVGPWNHLMGVLPAGDYRASNAGGIPFVMDRMIDFFNTYLNGEEPGFNHSGHIELYDSGLQEYALRPEGLWDPKAVAQRFYLDGAAGSLGCSPTGNLAAAAPTTHQTVTYTYDPYDPVVLEAAAVLDLGNAGTAYDNDWCSRSDALVFESQPFAEPTRIDGPISVHLKVRSDAANTSFFARLSWIDPAETAYNLREGAILLSHREGDDHKVEYVPGSEVTFDLPLAPLLWTLSAGSRLRLVVSSSGYPLVVPHPNVGDNWQYSRIAVPAEETVILDPADPAYVSISISR